MQGNYARKRRASGRIEKSARGLAARRADEPDPLAPTDGSLVTSADTFRRVFDSNIVGAFVGDVTGLVTEANACLLAMLGYTRADMPLRWNELTPPEWRALDEDKLREIHATGEAQNWDKAYLHRSGRRVPITVCAAVQADSPGAFIALVLDRTEKKQMEDEQRRRDEEYQHRLRALALEVSLTAERERHRIAQGLHDQIGQTLAVAKMKIGALRDAELDTAAATAVDELADLLRQTVEATRSLTFDLSPPLLYELGLEAALRSLVDRIEERHAIPCSFASDGHPTPLPLDSAVVAHQIVRELLFNIVKHARAESAAVSVMREGDRVRITVADDGVGFEACDGDPTFDAKGGFGLFSARERVRQLGGALDIESAPSQGTRVVLTLPLAPPNGDDT